MGKYDNQGNLDLESAQKIIQGGVDVLEAGRKAKLATIQLDSGAEIDEISTDVSLGGDSTSALVTESAIKKYADSGDASALSTANTYTDMQVASIDFSKIYEGYTSVECFDTTSEDAVIIKTEGLVDGSPGDSTSVIYYYTGYSTSDWDNPGNMVDGSLITYADTDTAGVAGDYYQVNSTNTAPSSGPGTVTKVEIRFYNQHLGIGHTTRFRPIFTAGPGPFGFANPEGSNQTANWSEWRDVTTDLNAPSPWIWSDANSMDVEVWGDIRDIADPPNQHILGWKVELRVTYNIPTQVPGSVERVRIDSDGLILETGVSAGEISNDTTLADDSTSALVTEHAIKSYVDDATLAGTSGTSGTSGITGTSGTGGTSGTSGITGTSGTGGTSGTSGVLTDPGTIGILAVTTRLTIPTSAPPSPEAGDIWIE
jgi:hypothetical protein